MRKLKPRSTDCCSLYLYSISSVVNSSVSKTLVAKINRPALRFSMATFSSQIATVASTLYLNSAVVFDWLTLLIFMSISVWYLDFFNRREAAFKASAVQAKFVRLNSRSFFWEASQSFLMFFSNFFRSDSLLCSLSTNSHLCLTAT